MLKVKLRYLHSRFSWSINNPQITTDAPISGTSLHDFPQIASKTTFLLSLGFIAVIVITSNKRNQLNKIKWGNMINQNTLRSRVEKMKKHALALMSIGAGDIEIVITEDGDVNDVFAETLSINEAQMTREIETAVYAHALIAATMYQGKRNINDLEPGLFGDLREEMVDSFKALFGTPCIDFRGDLELSIKTTSTFGINVE